MSLVFENMLALKNTISSGYGISYTTGNGTYLNSVYWAKSKEEVLAYATALASTNRSVNYKTELYFYDANTTYRVWRIENGTSKVVYNNSIADNIKYGLYVLKHHILLNSFGRFVYNLFGSQHV